MSQKAGEILTAAREKKGWTQEFAAGKLGISTKQYGKYEQGLFPKFKQEAVGKIEQLFGVRIKELIYEQNVPTGNSDSRNLQEDAAEYQTKTPTDKEGLMKALIASQEARIKLLEEKQAGDSRLIQVEATLQIVVGILNGLKIPEQSHIPSESGTEVVDVRLKNANKSESNVKQESRR